MRFVLTYTMCTYRVYRQQSICYLYYYYYNIKTLLWTITDRIRLTTTSNKKEHGTLLSRVDFEKNALVKWRWNIMSRNIKWPQMICDCFEGVSEKVVKVERVDGVQNGAQVIGKEAFNSSLVIKVIDKEVFTYFLCRKSSQKTFQAIFGLKKFSNRIFVWQNI